MYIYIYIERERETRRDETDQSIIFIVLFIGEGPSLNYSIHLTMGQMILPARFALPCLLFYTSNSSWNFYGCAKPHRRIYNIIYAMEDRLPQNRKEASPP